MKKPYKPRPGSRPHSLLQLQPGERMFFEAPEGRVTALMGQISVDFQRTGFKGTQRHIIGILPNTREVIELIMVTAVPKTPPALALLETPYHPV